MQQTFAVRLLTSCVYSHSDSVLPEAWIMQNDFSIDSTVLLRTEVLSKLCVLFISRNFPILKKISLSRINFCLK